MAAAGDVRRGVGVELREARDIIGSFVELDKTSRIRVLRITDDVKLKLMTRMI